MFVSSTKRPPEHAVGSRRSPRPPSLSKRKDGSGRPDLGGAVTDAGAKLPPPDKATKKKAHARMSRPMTVEQVESQIRKLETRLDRLIQKSQRKGDSDGHTSTGAEHASSSQRDSAPAERRSEVDLAAVDLHRVADSAGELLSNDYYSKHWGRIAMRDRSEDVDEFGLDPKFASRVQPLFDFLYTRYFRIDTSGAANVPNEGRCLIVSNHSGTFPYDGAMLKTAIRHAHPTGREMRWLAEDFIFYLPFVGAFMNRIGAVRACQENAERLLKQERLVTVFPEGIKGIGKLYRERYKLQRFGRGGFIRLCLRTDTPIIPCAVIGAEESAPMLFRLEYLANLLGVPYLPVTPTFPALGPLGLVPAPTKWRIELGEPIRFDGYGPEAADDSLLVGRLTEKVRTTIQTMLDRGLSDRQSVWFG
jgi:1-acyl-sn-glycerol-3-phosphate acyltransferase